MCMSKKIIVSTLGAVLFATALAGCSKSDSKNSVKATPEVTANIETQPAVTETAQPATTHTKHSEETLLNNVSYTLGYSVAGNISAQLKAQGATLDKAQVLVGFKEGISNEKGKFSQEQMKTIMQTFQKDLIAAQEKRQVISVLDNAKELLSNEQTPTIGPKNAKVAVIEFFDYRCVFCHKVAPIMEKVMDANPHVKYIFKEFPIFGQRWEASQYAAKMGIAAYMLNGAEGYLQYHKAVFSRSFDEVKLTVKDVDNAAKQVGVDIAKAEILIKDNKVTDKIAADMKLGFDKLGIQGTPVIIVMPISGATADNTTVIPGFAQQDAIQEAINKAREEII